MQHGIILGTAAWEKAVRTPPTEVLHSTARKAVKQTEHDQKRKATVKSKTEKESQVQLSSH